MSELIKSKIRTIPNFPKEGIMFRDITTLLKDAEGLNEIVKLFEERYKNKKIDFFSIDTEGFDVDVLESNDWKKFKPRVICIETVPHTSGKQNKNSQTYLENLGYKIVHQNNTNTIYELNSK